VSTRESSLVQSANRRDNDCCKLRALYYRCENDVKNRYYNTKRKRMKNSSAKKQGRQCTYCSCSTLSCSALVCATLSEMCTPQERLLPSLFLISFDACVCVCVCACVCVCVPCVCLCVLLWVQCAPQSSRSRLQPVCLARTSSPTADVFPPTSSSKPRTYQWTTLPRPCPGRCAWATPLAPAFTALLS
jgi:hypothetical protein